MEPEADPGPGPGVVRLCVAVTSGAAGALLAAVAGARPLDLAVWTVLPALVAVTLLELWPRARRTLWRARWHAPAVVIPDRPQIDPDPLVQAQEEVLLHARGLLVAAQARGAQLDELLLLAQALHESTLDLARATASAGGHVPQELLDEIALRDRAETSQPQSPSQP